MKAATGNFRNSLLLLLAFYFSVFALFYTVQSLFGSPGVMEASHLLNWDAMHYDTIRREMYSTGMVAFFPLFPLLWKLLPLSEAGISVVNGLMYIVSFAWISDVFQIQAKRLLLLASIPSLIFMFLPFSEALFFLSCTILLVGLKRNSDPLVLAGILLAGITRPVATVFIPAFLLLFWISEIHSYKTVKKYIVWSLVCILTFSLVLALQYFETGNLFSFFEVQKSWGNYLQWPSFPLNSWAGGFIVRLDAMAFFFGVAACGVLVYTGFKSDKLNSTRDQDRALIFSFSYLAFLTLIILATRGGVFNSLNRYLLCTVFFIVAVNYLLDRFNFQLKNILVLFLCSSIVWLAFGSYVHIQTVLKFELLSGYLLLLLASTAENRILKSAGYFSALAVNVIFMMIFLHRFLTGEWVG